MTGIPPGTHNLVVYALDGSYTTFQQEATIASGSSTEAVIEIEPVPFVNITFDLVVPEYTPQEMPIRLAGNLKQLGNTYADITGGVSAIASLMPVLSLQPDNHYKISISLPVGSDIRYKYTLGDGFWNSEHNQEGRFILRQLTVPKNDLVIKDEVFSWQGGNEPPIQFNVVVPSTTPPEESISIQFDIGYGWLHPVPMRKTLKTRVLPPGLSSCSIHSNQATRSIIAIEHAGVAAEDVTHGKPDPEVFLVAAQRLGAEPRGVDRGRGRANRHRGGPAGRHADNRRQPPARAAGC